MDAIKESYDDVGLPFNLNEIDQVHQNTNSETKVNNCQIQIFGIKVYFLKISAKSFC